MVYYLKLLLLLLIIEHTVKPTPRLDWYWMNEESMYLPILISQHLYNIRVLCFSKTAF